MLIAVATGCAAHDEEPAPIDPDEALVAGHLRSNGFTDFSIDRDDGTVLIEGDARATFADLLEAARSADDPSRNAQGYWANPGTFIRGQLVLTFQPRLDLGVKIVYGSSVSPEWRTAFNEAASAWASGRSCIRFVSSGYWTLNITKVALDQELAAAEGSFPTIGLYQNQRTARPGPTIKINRDFHCSSPNCGKIEQLSAAVKKNVALHELGHNIGFFHPESGNAYRHIPGTASGTSYATVMHANTDVNNPVTALSSDDILSRNKMFPCN
jgi:hypothetical protein